MASKILIFNSFLIAFCGLSVVSLQWASSGGDISFVWAASALLIAVLVRSDRAQWPAYLGLAMAGSLLAAGLAGSGWAAAPGMAIAHAVEALVAAALLLQRRSKFEDESFRDFLSSTLIVGVIAPAAGALCAVPLAHYSAGWPVGEGLSKYFLAHALGNITFIPLFGLLLDGEVRRWLHDQSSRRVLELLGMGAAVVVMSGLAFSPSHQPLLFLPLLAVLVATYRFHKLGAALAVVLLALTGIGMVSGGSGGGIAFFQFYLAVAVLCSQPLARDLAQRSRTTLALLESEALYELLAANATDIILKTDRGGFILYASPAVDRLAGYRPEELTGRHVLDLVHPSYVGFVMSEHDKAIEQREDATWVEYIAVTRDGEEHWFETQMHGLTDDHGQVYGAVSIIRSIDERKAFEEQLFEASLTDTLTGLVNRHAFLTLLQHYVDGRAGGCLAMFEIDHFRSINHQYGLDVGDKVVVIFANLAQSLVRSEDTVARIGGGKFGILLPKASTDQAEAVCQRILATISDTSRTVGSAIVRVTVSAGVSRIAGSPEDIMKAADFALYVAQAKGRDRLEVATGSRWRPDPRR